MKKKLLVVITALCLQISVALIAVIVGSDTAVSRQAAVTFPAIDSNNEMRGFAVFQNGFTLQNASTTCLFNDLFPVSGEIRLNSGSLTLAEDLVLANTTQLITGGNIVGVGHVFELPDQTDPFNFTGTMTLNAVDLIVNSPINLVGQTTFQGNCTLHGNGYTIDCSSGSIRIASGAQLSIHDAVLKGISSNTITNAATSSVLICNDVTWIQTDNYSFTQGSLQINGTVLMTGEKGFSYQSSQASTIKANSTWFFDAGMTFSYKPPSASKNLIVMESNSSILHLYETSMHSTTTGVRLTKGILFVDGTCPVYSDATTDGQAIAFGDGASVSNDLAIKIGPESGLDVRSGLVLVNNVNG